MAKSQVIPKPELERLDPFLLADAGHQLIGGVFTVIALWTIEHRDQESLMDRDGVCHEMNDLTASS
jgi:hypothetical protein